MKIVNFFGGPGTGKSTNASGLFFLMKLMEYEVELVTEYAKYLVWAERVKMFQEQPYIFAKQNHKLEILKNKVDWAITDSPLVLSAIFGKKFGWSDNFGNLVWEEFEKYNNIHIFLNRTGPYQPNGRNETEAEAIELDRLIKATITDKGMAYYEVNATPNAPWEIYKLITGKDHPTKLVMEPWFKEQYAVHLQ